MFIFSKFIFFYAVKLQLHQLKEINYKHVVLQLISKQITTTAIKKYIKQLKQQKSSSFITTKSKHMKY